MQDAVKLRHALLAMSAVVGRETRSFTRQPGRLFSALVRPLLWLVVFAAGFQNVYNLIGGIDAWSEEVDPSVPKY